MNVITMPQLTPAEKALVERFGRVAFDLPGNTDVARKRDEAIETLKFSGLPTRRVEAFHYTDLRRLLATVPADKQDENAPKLSLLIAGSTVLALEDGHAASEPGMPAGVSVTPLAGMLADGRFAAALDAGAPDDPVGALNTAFVSDGWFVDIEAGTELAAPLELQNLHAGGQAHVCVAVRVAEGAKATIVERQTGADGALVTSQSHLTLAENADICWIILQEQGEATSHLARFNAKIGAGAKLRLFIVNAGGKLVRQEVRVGTAGEGCEFQLRCVNLLGGDSHTDLTMVLAHNHPNTTSTEIVRNVVTGRAKGVFQGQIRVAPVAQKTDARMACNSLLLSDDTDFSAKPELEIFADDVACGHGATVTEIDHNHLFYLMARGIPEKEARGLLVKAFVAEIVEELDDEGLVDVLEARIDDWFAAHG